MTYSLRRRLFVGTTLASALVLAILCVVINREVHTILESKFDNVLLEKARSLASMVEQDEDKIHFDYEPPHFPEFEPGPRPAYFEIYLNGKRYKASPSLNEGHLPHKFAPGHETVRVTNETLPNGQPGRLLAYPFHPYVDPDIKPPTDHTIANAEGLLWVAEDTNELSLTFAQIRWLTIGLCGAATLFSGLAMLVVVRRAVPPVQAIADQIETIDETDLSRRLRPENVPAELAPIIDRLNGLLDRLRDAFARERAFTADVAHELRTPLAALLATLEVCRSRPRDGLGYEDAIDKSHGMLKQMETLVEKLLLLARADSGQLQIRREPVDAAALLQECWYLVEPRARQFGISISGLRDDEIRATGDKELLRIVFQNLLDNAISYGGTQAGAKVEIRWPRSAPGKIAVEIANPSHSLTSEDLPHLFERFWRKDASRSTTGIHAGLGLSLSQRLMMLQQGEILLRLENATFVARVEMPAPLDTPAARPDNAAMQQAARTPA